MMRGRVRSFGSAREWADIESIARTISGRMGLDFDEHCCGPDLDSAGPGGAFGVLFGLTPSTVRLRIDAWRSSLAEELHQRGYREHALWVMDDSWWEWAEARTTDREWLTPVCHDFPVSSEYAGLQGVWAQAIVRAGALVRTGDSIARPVRAHRDSSTIGPENECASDRWFIGCVGSRDLRPEARVWIETLVSTLTSSVVRGGEPFGSSASANKRSTGAGAHPAGRCHFSRPRLCVVSGGALGADQALLSTCLQRDTDTWVFLPHGLHVARTDIDALLALPRAEPESQREVRLLSSYSAHAPFTGQQAMERNHWIYRLGALGGGRDALGDQMGTPERRLGGTFVAQVRWKEGGTWQGAVAALRKSLPVLVRSDNSDGARALIDLGAVPVTDADIDSAAVLQLRLGTANRGRQYRLDLVS